MQRCDLTGKGKMYGNRVSHSMRHTKRVWKPNLQIKTLIIDGQKVRLKLAASTIRTLNKFNREVLKANEAKLALQEQDLAPKRPKNRVKKEKLTPKQKKAVA